MSRMNGARPLLRTVRDLSLRMLPERLRLRLFGDGWVSTLNALSSEIGRLAISSEDEFLSVGGKLQDFHGRTNKISEVSSYVAGLMSGREIDGIIHDFEAVADRLKQLEGASAKSSNALEHVLGQLDRMQSNLSGFKKVSMVLGVLCVSTRIESARLGQNDSGFITLADDVSKLSADIELKCAHLLQQSSELVHLVRQTLTKIQDLIDRQISQGEVVLNNTLSSLKSLTQRQEASHQGAERILTSYKAISQSMGEIVASLQFQDITRQRLEHTKQALDAVVQAPSGLTMAADVCQLQAAQLRSARDEFLAAVGKIAENLQNVVRHVTAASEETKELAGAANRSGFSFLSEIDTGVSAIDSALAEYASSNDAVLSAIAPVGQTLSDMAVYAHDIEGIGTRIRLIALNAIIKACHLGEEGAALSVVADAIHQLSAETCRQTTLVNEDLKSISITAQTLSTEMDAEAGRGGSEVVRISDTLDQMKVTLRNINEGILHSLKRIDDEGQSLSENIRETVGKITALGRVDSLITDVVSELEETTALLNSLFPRSATSRQTDPMEALEGAYTMEREREVHRSVEPGPLLSLAPHSMAAEPSAGEPLEMNASEGDGEKKDKSDAEDDLGDNVELF